MKRRSRLILIEQLGSAELKIARGLRAIGFEIRYLEPLGRLRSADAVDALRSEKIYSVQASQFPDLDTFAPLRVCHEIVARLIERLVSPTALIKLEAILALSKSDSARTRILLYEIIRGYLMPHGTVLAIESSLQKQGYRVWLWPKGGLGVCFIRPSWRGLVIELLKLMTAVIRRFSDRRVSAGQRSSNGVCQCPAVGVGTVSKSAEVLFFPHQGPAYGDLFTKDQYYSSQSTSPLHRSKVCHVELESEIGPRARKVVDEHYEAAGLRCHWLASRTRFKPSPGALISLCARVGPRVGLFALLLQHRLSRAMEELSVFPRARLALLGYENLFPRYLVVAMQECGIVVAAAQERFVFPFHPGFHLMLDHYFMHGEKAAEAVRSNDYCHVGGISITGDLRMPKRPLVRKEGRHRCLVLDCHSLETQFADAFAIGSSWANNRLFLEDILRLSAEFEDVEFTIRSKNTKWMQLEAFQDLVARVSERPNLAVDQERTFDRGSQLVSDADSVIARHTSLGDQALALGVPVLFHERLVNGDRLIAAVLDYSPFPILTRTYEELRDSFRRIVTTGHVLNADEVAKLRKYFYGQPSQKEPREKVQEILSEILASSQRVASNV